MKKRGINIDEKIEKQTNKGAKEEHKGTRKQFVGQKGLSMDGWADKVMERILVPVAREPAAEPWVGASQAQERKPSPGSVCSKLPHWSPPN